MSQSRKKLKSRSRQGSYGPSDNKKNNIDNKAVLSKIDNLRTNVKAEQKTIKVDNTQRNRFIAFVVIVVVGMSSLFVLGQIGTAPPPPAYTGTPTDLVNTVGGFQKDLKGTFIQSDGKITFFYAGGEFCPYCAMERWAIVMALEQFGTFSPLTHIVTPSNEGSIGTYTFVGSSYSSSKIDFQPVELVDTQHNTLQTPSTAQQNLINRYDPTGSIPLLVISGIYVKVTSGLSLNFNDFKSHTWDQINYAVTNQINPIYSEVTTESNNLVQVINLALNNLNTTTTTTPTSNTTTG